MISLISLLVFSLSVFSAQEVSKIDCKATYDDLDIPHQNFTSEEDFYFCFGFHHGADRAWQMDYFRRVTEGKNAEIYGYAHLKNDLMMKLLDLPSEAQKIWKTFSENDKKKLQNYANGVNEGFKIGKNSFEFKDLNYSPENWLPEHSLQVLLLQSFDQTRRTFFRDYQEEQFKENWGNKTADLFNHNDIPWDDSIIKDGEYVKIQTSRNQPLDDSKNIVKLWENFPAIFGEESGSNNWVISKNNSKSGNAFLANDPHLDLKTPMFWYWIHLKSNDHQVLGASLPGVPIVASGTNGKVSWGLTNSYIKTAEALFLDKKESDEITSFWPLVWVRLGGIKLPFFFKRFEKLNNQFRILPLELNSDKKIILKWSGFNLSSEDIVPMFQYYKSLNVSELDNHLKRVGVPSWNFVFADVNGDIGYRVIGKAYKISGEKTWGMKTQSSAEMVKDSFLSENEMPHLLNPQRGHIYTANNRHWPKDAIHSGGRGYSHSFRGFRINEKINVEQDFNSIKDLQCDEQAVDARFLVPAILSKIDVKEFKTWNFDADIFSVAPALYRRFLDLSFSELKVDEYSFYRLLNSSLSQEVLSQLKNILDKAREEVSGRTWEHIHRLNFPHLSQNSSWAFSPEIHGVGDTHSVNPGTSKWSESELIYEQTAGASLRLIIEMKSPKPKIFVSMPGKNRNYDQKDHRDPWNSWRNCKYHEIKY